MKNLLTTVAIVAMSSSVAFATPAEDCSTFEECKAVALDLQSTNTHYEGEIEFYYDLFVAEQAKSKAAEAATQDAFSDGYNSGYSSGYGIAQSDYEPQVENLEITVSSLEDKIAATQDAVDDLLSSWSISLSDSTNIPLAIEKIADKANLAGYYEGLDIGYDDGHSTALTSISEAFNDEFPTYITFGNSIADIVEAVANAAYSKVNSEFNQLIQNENFALKHSGGSEWIISNSAGSWVVDFGNIAEQAANTVGVAGVELQEDTGYITVTLTNGATYSDLNVTNTINAIHAEEIAVLEAELADRTTEFEIWHEVGTHYYNVFLRTADVISDHKTQAGENYEADPVGYITFVFEYIEGLQAQLGVK